ncbi:MFS transporter [Epidermidibacterium keratini]|uniref:MFS transporter n=1 Tax=Epidermidibacterium keratini TaxID=1891644 RepID=A0A7L4YQ96_9ACTN|nr:MFS transporter [Epidermidibacterium keratini]
MPTTHAAAVRHTGVLLASVALAQMLIGIDYNIVFVALPQIQQLGFSDAALQWVISSYAIGFGGFLLLGGRLVDYLGRRRMFLTGASLYAVGSVIGGLAANEAMLIGGRAI